jgi:hypothetical protein
MVRGSREMRRGRVIKRGERSSGERVGKRKRREKRRGTFGSPEGNLQ